MLRRPSIISLLLCLASPLGACPGPAIVPLVGEDPEVSALIQAPQADSPATSPMAAARRLHQALLQRDPELSWTLLSQHTRRVMNARGATIGVSGRDLLDSSTLPDEAGRVVKVRFDEVLFGGPIVDLVLAPEPSPTTGRAVIRMVTREGQVFERTFVLDTGAWKLDITTL